MELLHALPDLGTAPRFATSAADDNRGLFTLRLPSAPAMPERGGQSALLEQPQRPRLDDIDDHRVVWLPVAQERDHAVRARRGALHHALITADPHARNATQGV